MTSTGSSSSETVQDNDVSTIARVSHEAVRAYKYALGEEALPRWSDAPVWMRESTFAAVRSRLDNPGAPPSAQHEAWMNEREKAGWRHGAVRDTEFKTHPMMVPYEALPATERYKDALIQAVVDALSREVD